MIKIIKLCFKIIMNKIINLMIYKLIIITSKLIWIIQNIKWNSIVQSIKTIIFKTWINNYINKIFIKLKINLII